MVGDLSEPGVVDLHRADVDRAVRVLADRAQPPGLDADQKRQHAGRNMMNLGRRFQAALDHRFVGARGGSARN